MNSVSSKEGKMKTKIMLCSIILWLSLFTGSVFSGTEGTSNTLFGTGAGNNTGGDDDYDTFIGAGTGYSNTTASENTFVGDQAGYSNTTGAGNTFLEYLAGETANGSGNVFLGYGAGGNETGSNKLSIENSFTSAPLIYGEFDNDIVRINGRLGIWKSPGASYQLDVNGTVNATSFVFCPFSCT